MADRVPRGGWSIKGSLFTENEDITVSLQQTFDKANTFTVQIDVDGITPGRAVADIEWNVAGNRVKRTVDVGQGTAVTGNGESVRVVVRDVSPGGVGFPASGTAYSVAVTVAPGVRANFQMAVLTADEGLITIAAAASDTWTLPLSSGIIYFMVMTYADPPAIGAAARGIQVTQVDYSGAGLVTCEARQAQWIPLVKGAVTIAVDNHTANNALISIIYGIEG